MYYPNITRVIIDQQVARSKPYVWLLYGPPGTGKTHDLNIMASFYSNDDPEQVYWKPPSKDWFNGYHSQRVIVIDDFGGGIDYFTFLRLLDGEPLLVETKGSFVSVRATTILLTSMSDIGEWYEYTASRPCYAVARRIHRFIRYERNTITDLSDEHHTDLPPEDAFIREYPPSMHAVMNFQTCARAPV